MVQVQHQHGQGLAGAVAALQLDGAGFVHVAPGQGVGERVAGGQQLQLGPQAVASHQHGAHRKQQDGHGKTGDEQHVLRRAAQDGVAHGQEERGGKPHQLNHGDVHDHPHREPARKAAHALPHDEPGVHGKHHGQECRHKPQAGCVTGVAQGEPKGAQRDGDSHRQPAPGGWAHAVKTLGARIQAIHAPAQQEIGHGRGEDFRQLPTRGRQDAAHHNDQQRLRPLAQTLNAGRVAALESPQHQRHQRTHGADQHDGGARVYHVHGGASLPESFQFGGWAAQAKATEHEGRHAPPLAAYALLRMTLRVWAGAMGSKRANHGPLRPGRWSA
ncbi:hypothetical protein D3C71_1386340 [compost metagenome]